MTAANIRVCARWMICASFMTSLLTACRAESGATGTAVAGDAERGRLQIGALGCGACHIVDGVPNATGRVGPSLHGFSTRILIAGVLPNTSANLQHWLINPPAFSPGTAMPKLDIDERTAADMAAYLHPRP